MTRAIRDGTFIPIALKAKYEYITVWTVKFITHI